jgi:hypothetical protein
MTGLSDPEGLHAIGCRPSGFVASLVGFVVDYRRARVLLNAVDAFLALDFVL